MLGQDASDADEKEEDDDDEAAVRPELTVSPACLGLYIPDGSGE